MLIEIDLASSEPLYNQIAAGVRKAIVASSLRPGDALPPGRALAAALGVNLDTVQRAYRLLADEGVVVSRVGRGTRVVDTIDPRRLGVREQVDALIASAAAIGISRHELVEMIRAQA